MALKAKYLFRTGDLTTDSTGNGNTLTNTNSPTFTSSSPVGRGITYNGSNNYSIVPIKFTKALVPTISFLLKQVGTTANQTYLGARYTTGGDSDRGIQYDTRGTYLNMYARYDSGGDETNGYMRQIFPYNDGKWHYITINETSTGRNALVDGKYTQFGAEYADARAYGNLTTWLLGARYNNLSVERYASCQMADFEVHTTNLTVGQHKTKYAYYLGML